MQREFLRGLGLERDVEDRIMAEHGRTVGNLNTQVTNLNAEVETLTGQIAERDAQITQLSENNQGNTELQEQIANLQRDLEARDTEAQTALSNTRLDYEIRLGLQSAGARNVTAASALLDRNAIRFGEDGTIVGLDEQIKTIQEANDYLFQSATPDPAPAKPSIGAKGNPNPEAPPTGNEAANVFASVWK